MKTTILAALLYIGIVSRGFPDLVYDIDYEPPTYTNGQQIVGAGNISDSINGFTNQGLLIHDGGGVIYSVSQSFTSGIHHVSWDFAVPVDQGSSAIINAIFEPLTAPIALSVTMGSGPYEIRYAAGLNPPTIPFIIGQSYSFDVWMDLDGNSYDLSIDGVLLSDDVAIPDSTGLWGVSFGQNQTLGLQAGVDNFRWEVIPEPTSLLLILFGGAALYGARRKHWIGKE